MIAGKLIQIMRAQKLRSYDSPYSGSRIIPSWTIIDNPSAMIDAGTSMPSVVNFCKYLRDLISFFDINFANNQVLPSTHHLVNQTAIDRTWITSTQ